jgi:hypothetical protein
MLLLLLLDGIIARSDIGSVAVHQMSKWWARWSLGRRLSSVGAVHEPVGQGPLSADVPDGSEVP